MKMTNLRSSIEIEGGYCKKGLEDITEHIISSQFVGKKDLNSVENIVNLWKWAKNNDISKKDFFKNVPDFYEELTTKRVLSNNVPEKYRKAVSFFSKKNCFISYDHVLQIFNNVEDKLSGDSFRFFQAGKESFKSSLKNNLLPLFFKKDIGTLFQIAAGVNSQYNRNKYFNYTTVQKEDNLMTGKLEIVPEKGISHPKNIVFWNWGHYLALIEKFININNFEVVKEDNSILYKLNNNNLYNIRNKKSEIVERLYFEVNENTGSFFIEADFNSLKEKWYDKYSLMSILKKKSTRLLEEQLIEMQKHQYEIKREIKDKTKIIKECELEFEDRDSEAAFHSFRLGHMMSKVGIQLGFSPNQLYVATVGARLHDIGKYLIPDEIKNLPRRFTREERSFMETHTLLGAYVLLEKGVENEIVQMALFHHEAINGKGYPLRITKEVMSIETLLIQILDKIEAQYSSRVYRSKDLDESQVSININKDKSKGELHEELTNFTLNLAWPTLIESGTVPNNYSFESKLKYSKLMEKEIGYVKGHHRDFDVKIPKIVQDLLKKYKSPVIFDKDTLRTRIKEEISRTYHEKIKSPEYKTLFKNMIPESMFKDNNEFETFYLGKDRRDNSNLNLRLENRLRIVS